MRFLQQLNMADVLGCCPNGAPSLSPGLRGTSYPGSAARLAPNLEKVAAHRRAPTLACRHQNTGLNLSENARAIPFLRHHHPHVCRAVRAAPSPAFSRLLPGCGGGFWLRPSGIDFRRAADSPAASGRGVGRTASGRVAARLGIAPVWAPARADSSAAMKAL